jgi:hypothetical protein
MRDIEIEFADIFPTGIRSSELVEDSFAILNDTKCSVASTTHLGESSISPMYLPDTAPVVILVLVKLTGDEIVDGSVFTHEVPL